MFSLSLSLSSYLRGLSVNVHHFRCPSFSFIYDPTKLFCDIQFILPCHFQCPCLSPVHRCWYYDCPVHLYHDHHVNIFVKRYCILPVPALPPALHSVRLRHPVLYPPEAWTSFRAIVTIVVMSLIIGSFITVRVLSKPECMRSADRAINYRTRNRTMRMPPLS